MKKLLLSVFVLSCFTSLSYSQGNFELTDTEGNVVTNDTIYVTNNAVDETLEAIVILENTSTSALSVILKKTEISVINGTTNTFCWGPSCYGPSTFESNPVNIEPGVPNNTFHGDYVPILHNGQSVILYTFYEDRNPNDSASVMVFFQAGPVSVNNLIDKNMYFFSSPYPNPAQSYTTFDYNINKDTKGELVIFNIIGAITGRYKIEGVSGKKIINTSEYNSGVYFYSFVVNNEVVRTGKLNIAKK